MLNLLFTFVSFAWFVASDQFRTKKYLPSILLKIMDICSRMKLYKRKKHIPKNADNSKVEQSELIAELNTVSKLNEISSNFEEKLNSLNLFAFFFMVIFMFISYIYLLLTV